MTSGEPESVAQAMHEARAAGQEIVRRSGQIQRGWHQPDLGPPATAWGNAPSRIVSQLAGLGHMMGDPRRWTGISSDRRAQALYAAEMMDNYLGVLERVALREERPDAVDLEVLEGLLSYGLRLADALQLKHELKDQATPDEVRQQLQNESLQLELTMRQANIEKSLTAATKAAVDAERVAGAAEDRATGAAGRVAAISLSHHYDTFAKREKSTAGRFRTAALALLLGLVLLAVLMPREDQMSVAQLAERIGVLLTVAGASAYCAREAGRHRRWSIWAETLGIQLETLDAFLAPMDHGERASVRKEFGMRVFGALPTDNSSAETDAVTLPQAALERIVTALLERRP